MLYLVVFMLWGKLINSMSFNDLLEKAEDTLGAFPVLHEVINLR